MGSVVRKCGNLQAVDSVHVPVQVRFSLDLFLLPRELSRYWGLWLASLSAAVLEELLLENFLLFVTDEQERQLHLLEVLDGLGQVICDDRSCDVQPTELLDHTHV